MAIPMQPGEKTSKSFDMLFECNIPQQMKTTHSDLSESTGFAEAALND